MTPELMEAGAKALAEHKARASRPGAVLTGEEAYFGQGVAWLGSPEFQVGTLRAAGHSWRGR